jgi:hypothetical protein
VTLFRALIHTVGHRAVTHLVAPSDRSPDAAVFDRLRNELLFEVTHRLRSNFGVDGTIRGRLVCEFLDDDLSEAVCTGPPELIEMWALDTALCWVKLLVGHTATFE